jgi:hypothetical protein
MVLKRWLRFSILITRVFGLLGGLSFLVSAGLLYADHGVLRLDVVLVGIAFPVVMWWMARVMERNPPA